MNVDTEFVLAKTCGDIRMRFRKDIGIDAECNASPLFQLRGAFSELLKLAFALDIEQQDSGPQCKIDFRRGFADPREDDVCRG